MNGMDRTLTPRAREIWQSGNQEGTGKKTLKPRWLSCLRNCRKGTQRSQKAKETEGTNNREWTPI
jgi:hypothetical protein